MSCEVSLVPKCKFTSVDLDELKTSPEASNAILHKCTKEEVRELHTMTIYECKNVTKTHCTTLWDIDEDGEKVWAGNDGDCKDVTWEECDPTSKEVPVMVPTMECMDYSVEYMDLVNSTTSLKSTEYDCTVKPIQECKSKTTTKCGSITYQKCSVVPETECDMVPVIVPAQEQLHKKWCQFDQADEIDFDVEVKKILEDEEEEKGRKEDEEEDEEEDEHEDEHDMKNKDDEEDDEEEDEDEEEDDEEKDDDDMKNKDDDEGEDKEESEKEDEDESEKEDEEESEKEDEEESEKEDEEESEKEDKEESEKEDDEESEKEDKEESEKEEKDEKKDDEKKKKEEKRRESRRYNPIYRRRFY